MNVNSDIEDYNLPPIVKPSPWSEIDNLKKQIIIIQEQLASLKVTCKELSDKLDNKQSNE